MPAVFTRSEIELSIIIPALDAAPTLEAAIAALAAGSELPGEVIVVDGGSLDDTVTIARRCGARPVRAERGRGGQLATGAKAASGDWLLFLHADTILAPGWADAVGEHVRGPYASHRAAVFRFALDDDTPGARRLEAVVAWRTRRLGLPYGDQGLLVSRTLYDEIGGFRPLVLMEDVDIVRRIGRRRLEMLDIRAVTSAARFRGPGYLRRSARNLFCLSLYFLGVPPTSIARIYR